MVQLRALVWLKWRLFRNALRSRSGAANRAASLLGTLAALGMALIVAAGLGLMSYGLATDAGSFAQLQGGASSGALFILFGMLSTVFVMWSTVPLSFGGGNRFDPGLLLLYPIGLPKLFAIDLLSELTGLASIFAMPSVFAIALGAGFGHGRVGMAAAVAACATLFGIALAKLLATAIGALMQRRRTRGETVLALVAAVGGMTGALMSQVWPLVERNTELARGLRQSGLVWTPPGVVALALTEGMQPGGTQTYVLALAALAGYTSLAIALAYLLARRAVAGGRSSGGNSSGARRPVAATIGVDPKLRGWRLPLISEELSAIVEKELRYVARNPQLRTLALIPIFFIFWTNVAFKGEGGEASGASDWFARFATYAGGWREATGAAYVFMILSSLSCNLFAYDGAGMRSLILSPVDRRKILLAKNVAVAAVAAVFSLAVVLVGCAFAGECSWGGVLFAALCFVFFAAMFALVGNEVSMRYPKRLQFGKRMGAAGVTGLLLIPLFITMLIPPALAVWTGARLESHLVKYGILAAFAGAGGVLYGVLITRQGRQLAARELEILDVVSGRSDDGGGISG